MNEELLPLFPLQVVLFPHAALPLHIFEERYRTLLRTCIRESSEFGVVMMKGEELADVGCSAAVTSVLQMYEDGRMDVLVEGRRRFRTGHVDDTRAPYLVGTVEYIEERGELPDMARFSETVRLYNQLVTLVYAGKVKLLDPEVLLPDLSFVMAQKAGMELEQRQELLEGETEDERLGMLHEYLTAVLPRLKKLEEVERVIRSDGYL
jgi:Lon protease-like protein